MVTWSDCFIENAIFNLVSWLEVDNDAKLFFFDISIFDSNKWFENESDALIYWVWKKVDISEKLIQWTNSITYHRNGWKWCYDSLNLNLKLFERISEVCAKDEWCMNSIYTGIYVGIQFGTYLTFT